MPQFQREAGQHGPQPAPFFGGIHRLGTWACGLGTNVDDVGAIDFHGQGAFDGALGLERLTSV